jgi:hypothetical protein
MFGTTDAVVGNAGLAITLAIVAPAVGQEEFGVEHGAKARWRRKWAKLLLIQTAQIESEACPA